MDRYVVVGNPVEHSLSPDIHRAFAQQTGQTLEYAKLFAPRGEFAPTLDAFFDAFSPAHSPLPMSPVVNSRMSLQSV